MTMERKAAVIGYPVKQSLSPVIHQYWLKENGIKGVYERLEVKPDNLEQTVKQLVAQGYNGFNVTVPHKEQMYGYVDKLEDIAVQIGAVNTVVIQQDGSLLGTNTDAYGFIKNIHACCPGSSLAGKNVLVLGAGGAARAVAFGLLQESVASIYIANRTFEKAKQLADIFGKKIKPIAWEERHGILKHVDILVNSSVLGMKGQDILPLNLESLPRSALVVDIVYKPLITDLLRQAQLRGNPTVDGIGMLIYQAVRGFELFFGQLPRVTPELKTLVTGLAV